MNNIGKQVIVYDYPLFTVPVEGVITGASTKRDTYTVDFSISNPGGHNVTKHSGKYFLKRQCKIKTDDVSVDKIKQDLTHLAHKFKVGDIVYIRNLADTDKWSDEFRQRMADITHGEIIRVSTSRSLNIEVQWSDGYTNWYTEKDLLPLVYKRHVLLSKDTNPKDSIGIQKLPFSTISGPAMGELGLAMLEGALKYGRHNYRAIGIRYSVYFDAAMRHLWSWWEGEDIDPDSSLPHIIKAMACLMILRDATIQGQFNDDRPPKTPNSNSKGMTWVEVLNVRTKALRAKYPNPKEPYTEKGTDK